MQTKMFNVSLLGALLLSSMPAMGSWQKVKDWASNNPVVASVGAIAVVSVAYAGWYNFAAKKADKEKADAAKVDMDNVAKAAGLKSSAAAAPSSAAAAAASASSSSASTSAEAKFATEHASSSASFRRPSLGDSKMSAEQKGSEENLSRRRQPRFMPRIDLSSSFSDALSFTMGEGLDRALERSLSDSSFRAGIIRELLASEEFTPRLAELLERRAEARAVKKEEARRAKEQAEALAAKKAQADAIAAAAATASSSSSSSSSSTKPAASTSGTGSPTENTRS